MLSDELTSLLFVAAVLISVVYIFIRIALRLRKHGGSMTTIMHASTYEFLNKDMRASVEEVVETKANKKLKEESSDKPINDL